ncbi:hypothetical protein TWF102_005916 [Orbilia oligospora]|uniref:Uncharacterized protein n=2 Tax=Orbilia oligospora TaxID=2813651 RepID=A0A7C8JB42_ORBOL|nr:hypothetical protein TWF102_005916 [Orbilia oligospora]KAF3108129.1 hypothetical protein TWF103_005688 [Orbilia oligospora]
MHNKNSILNHREDALETIPSMSLSQSAGIKHLSLPGGLLRASSWVTNPKTTFRELKAFRLTNINSSQDFIGLWRILEKNVDSLQTLYLSSVLKHGEIIGMLFFLDIIDPVFRLDLKDLMPKLIAIKTNPHLTNLRHLRIRGIPNLNVMQNTSCNCLFNLHNLWTLRLDSCVTADDFLLEISKNHRAPNLRSLQLFSSCRSETLNEAISMLQTLETLHLCPYYKPYAATQEKL